MDDERRARIEDARQQCERVEALHCKMLRGEMPTESDCRIVARLIRLLVEAWV